MKRAVFLHRKGLEPERLMPRLLPCGGLGGAAFYAESSAKLRAAFCRDPLQKQPFCSCVLPCRRLFFVLQNAPFRGSKTQLLPAAKPAFSVLKRGVFRGLKQRFLPSEMRFSAPIRQPENAFERVLFGEYCFVCGFCKKSDKISQCCTKSESVNWRKIKVQL